MFLLLLIPVHLTRHIYRDEYPTRNIAFVSIFILVNQIVSRAGYICGLENLALISNLPHIHPRTLPTIVISSYSPNGASEFSPARIP